MHKPSSYSVAPGDSSRQSILSRGALLGVVGMALIGLVLVFPKDDLLSRLRRDTVSSDRELTIAYLRNLIRTEQKDVGLRLLLVEKLIAAREFAEAQTVLMQTRRLSADGGQRVRLVELDTQLAWSRFRAVRERYQLLYDEMQWDQVDGRHRGARVDATTLAARVAQLRTELDGARKQLEDKLRAVIPQLSNSKTAFELMEQAVDVGVPALQQDILARMRGVPMRHEELVRAAQKAISLGQFQAASEFYLLAKSKSNDGVQRRELILQSVKVQLAAGQPKQAYQMATRELQGKDLPPAGDAIWWQIVEWALAAGQPHEAAVHLRQVVPQEWSAQQLAQNMTAPLLAKALDVALAGADLPAAMRIAQAGLIHRPRDAKLRERYAQVLEWGGKPQESLAQWLALMQLSANARAQANVLRLAPMLYDEDALLVAWIAASNQRTLSMDEIRRAVEVHERVGEPEKALEFLARMAVKKPDRHDEIQHMRALLLERMGKPTQALAILDSLRKRTGTLTRSDAVRLVALYMRRADFNAALNALLSYKPMDGASFDTEYWDLCADLAYEANQTEVARDAFSRLLEHSVRTKKLVLRDYQVERMMRNALDYDQAAHAITLARKLRPLLTAEVNPAVSDRLMTLWLEALTLLPLSQTLRGDLDLWMAALTTAQSKRLDFYPEWLNRRAFLYTAMGEKNLAAADYRASLSAEENGSVRASYWWLLIDKADGIVLRRELTRANQRIRADPSLLEVQGAGWQFLGEWRQALGFYRQQTREVAKSQDALWLANYADVLEQAGDAALALRVRKQSFMLLSQTMARYPALKQREAAQALILRLRLSESFSSGVEKERLQTMLARTLQDNALDADLRKQMQSLIVSWAVGSQNGSGPGGARSELARRWFWIQQARKLSGDESKAQTYAQTALALAEGDLQALDLIMERSARELQPLDRLNALRLLARDNPQRLAQAATLGGEMAQKEAESPRSDVMQEALEQDLRKLASRVRLNLISKSNESLVSRGAQVSADIAISPRLRLTMDLDRVRHQSSNPSVLVLPAQEDVSFRAGARLAIAGGEISGQVTRRSAWANVTGLVLQLARQIDSRTSVQASMELRQPSSESAPLTVAGMQDRVAVNLSHQLAKDTVLGMEGGLTRYRTQNGASVGRGHSIGLNGNYYLRSEYPDLSLRASLRRQSMTASGAPDLSTAALHPAGVVPNADFFMPEGATTLNLSLGYGLTQSLDSHEAYSRALRPYAQIGAERRLGNDAKTSGWLSFGMRGAVAGRDQLVFGIDVKPAPKSANGPKLNRELRLQYEWIGDR